MTLSFEATKDTTFEDYHIVEVATGIRLLRFAMVYGANASGKSICNTLSTSFRISYLQNQMIWKSALVFHTPQSPAISCVAIFIRMY